MRRRSCEDRLGFSLGAIHVFEAIEESRHSSRTDRNMPPDSDVPVSQFTWHHTQAFVRFWVLYPKLFGQLGTESGDEFR